MKKMIFLLLVAIMDNIEPIRPQPKQEEILMSQADITFCGGGAGGGKTFTLLLEPLINIDDPNFNSIYFRNTRPELTAGGSAWDTSSKIYTRYNAKPNETDLSWKFPEGSKIKFSALQYDKDVYSYHSSQIPLIMFDEVQRFSKFQFFYMMTRNRKPTGYKKSCWIVASFNPEPGWVVDLLQWWWDQDTGYFIPERSGIVRYFFVRDDEVVWVDKDERDERGNRPKSLTFILAHLEDNKILRENDPGYEANLMAQDYVTRERLLKGNCLISYKGGIFKKEWFIPIKREDIPKGMIVARYWDWAATEAKKGKDPDYTVGSLCGVLGGDFYILDIDRFREAPGTAEKKVIKHAEKDGYDTEVGWEEEKASAGKYNTHYLSQKLLGYKTHPDPVSGDKVERAKPLAASAEHGHVYYVVAEWNRPMFAELGTFGSGEGHKDIVDSLTGCHKILTQTKRVFPNYSITKAEKFIIDWKKTSANTLHYGTLFQTNDMTLFFMAGLWDAIDGILYIYKSRKFDTIVPEVVAIQLIKDMNMRKTIVNKLVGCEHMMCEKKSTGAYINKKLAENKAQKRIGTASMYERTGAIAYSNSLFMADSIVFNEDLKEAAAQVAGWYYKESGPIENQGFCECLCLMVNELRRDLSRELPKPRITDYVSPEKTEKKPRETWQIA